MNDSDEVTATQNKMHSITRLGLKLNRFVCVWWDRSFESIYGCSDNEKNIKQFNYWLSIDEYIRNQL